MQQNLIINLLSSVVCHLSSVICSWPLYICRGFSTNHLIFMQNKPNSLNVQIYINVYYTKKYKNQTAFRRVKNKPNSNPIKPNCQKAKINVNLTLTKDYRKKDDFSVRINKPNFRNGQNERKLNFNKVLKKKRLFSRPKNKPNSNPISPKGQNELKIACQKIRPHPHSHRQKEYLALRYRTVYPLQSNPLLNSLSP